MSTTTLKCGWCGKKFKKSNGELNRRRKAGQIEFFCSQSHQVQRRNQLSPGPGNMANLNPANQLTELSPFKWFMCRVRNRKKDADIDAPYLKGIWEQQKGICPLTGWEIVLPDSTMGWKNGKSPKNASLDRIDSSRGYEKGNVRFVALIVNLAKADFEDSDVIFFCHAVSNRLEKQ